MRGVNSIQLEWRDVRGRPGLVAGDFVLDGRPLLEHCERATGQTYDVASPIGWTPSEHQASFVERLLLRQPALLPSGRRELLVCPECADLGCGCISADISSDREFFVWKDIGFENDYDPTMSTIFPMGHFVISRTELLHTFRRLIPGLSADSP